MTSRSSFLFASASFWEGAGRVVDVGNTLTQYNESSDPETADAVAMALDWLAVGDDIRFALKHRVGNPSPAEQRKLHEAQANGE